MDRTVKGRLIKGILGRLVREHFPGIVTYKGKEEPAYTFGHYAQARDLIDRQDRLFDHKAERVVEEFWVSLQSFALLNSSPELDIIDFNCVYMQDFFRIAPEEKPRARDVAIKSCKKLVHQMFNDAKWQAVVDWHAANNKIVYKKPEARAMRLTREQYLTVSIQLQRPLFLKLSITNWIYVVYLIIVGAS